MRRFFCWGHVCNDLKTRKSKKPNYRRHGFFFWSLSLGLGNVGNEERRTENGENGENEYKDLYKPVERNPGLSLRSNG